MGYDVRTMNPRPICHAPLGCLVVTRYPYGISSVLHEEPVPPRSACTGRLHGSDQRMRGSVKMGLLLKGRGQRRFTCSEPAYSRQHLSAKKDRARPWTAVLSSGFNWSDLCRVLRNTRDPEVCASSVSASRVDMILPAADHIMAFAGSASEQLLPQPTIETTRCK